MCPLKGIDFWLRNKNTIWRGGDRTSFSGEPPFRVNLLFGMLKVVLGEPPFRDQPYWLPAHGMVKALPPNKNNPNK